MNQTYNLGGQTRRQNVILSLHGLIDVLDVVLVRAEYLILVQEEHVVLVQEEIVFCTRRRCFS